MCSFAFTIVALTEFVDGRTLRTSIAAGGLAFPEIIGGFAQRVKPFEPPASANLQRPLHMKKLRTPGPPGLMTVATIDDGPFHLATWATSSISDDACSKLRKLGWRESRTVNDRPTSSQGSSASTASGSEQQSVERDAGGLPDHGKQPIGLQRFREVIADFHKEQKRVTYEGLGVVAHHCGLCGAQEIGRPSSFRCIELLPLEQEYLICRKDGTYSGHALAKWHHEAPHGYGSFAILSREDVGLYLNLPVDHDSGPLD
jgi:hypothetical protein